MVRRKEFVLELSTSPVDNVRSLREIGETYHWSMARIEGSRMVDRFAIIMPMVQSARSLGLIFEDGPFQGLEMHSWQETKGSSGAVGKVAWLLPGGIESPQCKALVHLWASKLPRCPWKWTFGERSSVGFLLPVWRRSRKNFAKVGLSEWPFTTQTLSDILSDDRKGKV